MAKLEITTQIGCGISCRYCPQNRVIKAYKKRSPIYTMSFDVFKKCLDKIPSYVIVVFSGMCEPWSNSDCIKMVRYAHQKGHTINIFTTMVGMVIPDIDILEQIPFDRFVIHLPSVEGYEKIKVDSTYLSLLNRIASSNINATYFIYGNGTHPDIQSIVQDKIQKKKGTTRAGNLLSGSVPLRKNKGEIFCKWDLGNILLPNGEVVLCCMDYGLQHILGNLLLSNYDDLFKRAEYKIITQGLTDESSDILCRYCEYSGSKRAYKLQYINKILKRMTRLKKW